MPKRASRNLPIRNKLNVPSTATENPDTRKQEPEQLGNRIPSRDPTAKPTHDKKQDSHGTKPEARTAEQIKNRYGGSGHTAKRSPWDLQGGKNEPNRFDQSTEVLKSLKKGSVTPRQSGSVT